LLVLLFGPTGAGKSSLFNALAGRYASRVGVLRPTTREVVVLVRSDEREVALGEGTALGRIEPDRVQLIEEPDAPAGLVLLDAPDLDSVEHANRELAERLVEAADLGIFVTSAVRYADRVPWDTLARVRERGLPLIVVLNRMPSDADDARSIVGDIRRLLTDAGIDDLALEGPVAGTEAADETPGEGWAAVGRGRAGQRRAPPPPTEARTPRVRIVAVTEGALDPRMPALARDAVAPIRAVVDDLAADRDRRRALAARALAGSIAGLAPAHDTLADDAEHVAIDVDPLARTARDIFRSELRTLRDDLAHGSFLRAEAIRQWHAFVGADEVTRLFSQGIGRVRGTLSALIRGMPKAPVSEVRDETIEDLSVLTRTRLSEAVRRTATAWADAPSVSRRIADDPMLWSPSPDLDRRLHERLAVWATSIAEDVRSTGGRKRTLARGASVGVNAAGIGVMLATFAHTAGLTGAEVGVAAATAVLNQKLLEALFGEAALVEMIGRARQRLLDELSATFGEELDRFEALVASGDELRSIAEEARAAAADARRMPATLPADVLAVMADPDADAWPAATAVRAGAVDGDDADRVTDR
jgi:energy-coupling factor transporter ATP-binding protein EcfA2